MFSLTAELHNGKMHAQMGVQALCIRYVSWLPWLPAFNIDDITSNGSR